MKDDPSPWNRATQCVHGGYRASSAEKAVVPPLVRSTTFLLDDEAYALRAQGRSDRALIYGREGNPTVMRVEERLSVLEGAERSLLFASGTAALHGLLMATLEPGSHVITSHQVFGGTRELLRMLLPRIGVEETIVDVGDLDALAAALTPRTGLVLFESITNPTLSVADVTGIVEVVRAGANPGACVAVDATFASPMGQHPLELGADVVHHSATKYLGGHSDVIGGSLSFARDDDTAQASWRWRNRGGGCMDPESAALLERGLKTLALRMGAHTENASFLAQRLEEGGRVERVFYPGLASHPTHAIAERVLELTSGMLSIVVPGGDAAALSFCRGLELILEATSLGGVESLVSLPFNMSHSHFTPEERLQMGIPPGLARISVGVEDPRDLLRDLERALDRARA